MRVTRLLINRFRGWEYLDLRPREHVLLAGVPRAGRTDIITALMRVLDPDGPRTAQHSDLHQQTRQGVSKAGDEAAADESEAPVIVEPAVTLSDYAEVEVTITDFDPDVQQLFDGYLEPLDVTGQVSDELDVDPDTALCARIAYRLTYDSAADTLDTVVYFPARSNPAIGQYAKVPANTRRALPVVVLNTSRPLHLRTGGNLRRLIDVRDPGASAAAVQALRSAVGGAIVSFSTSDVVAGAIDAVLNVGGAGTRLGDAPVTATNTGFLAEDGSVSALLGTLRPAMCLDSAGELPLTSHGSTATAVLAAAEAMLMAQVPGAIVLADDFGDHLDTATAEHLAALLRARSGQVWLSTRRPGVARAFEPTELVRLVRHAGIRSTHQLVTITDRKALTAMRQLHTQLLPAVTAPTVAITEGPHDVASYNMADRRYPPGALPLSAYGVRLIAAGTGGDGGVDQIPRVAELAKQLGFRVVVLVDRDKASTQSAGQLGKIQAACDVVIRLPKGAIEKALVAGVNLDKVRAASATLTAYGIPDPMNGRPDDAALTELCKVLHKQGLHEQLLEALYAETGTHPPTLAAALDSVVTAADPLYSGPALVDLAEPPAPSVSNP